MAFWVVRLDVYCILIRKLRKWFHFLAAYVPSDDQEKSLISKNKGMQSKVNIHCTIEYEIKAIKVFLVNSMPN